MNATVSNDHRSRSLQTKALRMTWAESCPDIDFSSKYRKSRVLNDMIDLFPFLIPACGAIQVNFHAQHGQPGDDLLQGATITTGQ
jgi:hypothetical protein